MKIIHHIQSHIEAENFSNIFLYGAFMFTNIDYVGIVDYLIKAILGALIWYGFKYLQEYFSTKVRLKHEQLIKELRNKVDEKNKEGETK